MVYFGPSGNPTSFYDQGHKSSLEMPKWINSMGLNAYEYQCSKGVKISSESAAKLGEKAKENGVLLSIHSPYYINLATPEEEKRIKSVDYIMQTLRAADSMGAERIVVHSGACAKISRESALEYAKKTLEMARDAAKSEGLLHIHICPETMGKINQLGDLDEVMELCLVDDSFLPAIDFGHLNARSFGALKTYEDFLHIFDTMENKLGFDRMKIFHSHFSKIEYTIPGGEKKHLTFADDVYGPNFEYVAEIVYKKNLSPVFICESDGTMAEDALIMQQMYRNCGGK